MRTLFPNFNNGSVNLYQCFKTRANVTCDLYGNDAVGLRHGGNTLSFVTYRPIQIVCLSAKHIIVIVVCMMMVVQYAWWRNVQLWNFADSSLTKVFYLKTKILHIRAGANTRTYEVPARTFLIISYCLSVSYLQFENKQ